jgi:hypothetical protein
MQRLGLLNLRLFVGVQAFVRARDNLDRRWKIGNAVLLEQIENHAQQLARNDLIESASVTSPLKSWVVATQTDASGSQSA